MSGMPAPAVAPHPSVARPVVVEPRPKRPNRWGFWIVLILIAAGLSAVYVWRKPRNAPSGTAGIPAIRTAMVTSGPVERTLRLTGVTAAANYASLVTPNLRGSRSDYARALSVTTSTTPASLSSSSSSSSGSASSPVTSSAANASSAFTAATSRLGSTTTTGSTPATASSSSSSSSASGSSTPTSSAMGSSGLGSTSDSLPSASGAGGGISDFTLILQDVAAAGTIVHKGEQLAEFDRQYMLMRLDDYKASVIQSEAGLKTRRANLDIAHKSHEQLVNAAKGALEKARLDLKTIPVLSDIDAERARLAFQQAEAKYQQLLKEVPFVLASEAADTRVSELDMEQARLELKRAEMNADKMIATAPIDGLVVMQSIFRSGDLVQIQRGDQLWPGLFYMQLVDTRTMVINATVNQVDVEHLRIGQKARVHFDAYPDLTLAAHVLSIAAMTKQGGSRAQFVKNVGVRLKIDVMDKRVIPDLSVSADIIEDADEQAAAIAPVGAIFEDNSPKPYVFVQAADGWQRRDVELGIQNYQVAAVKSGITPGEVLALDRPSAPESPQGSQ